MTALSEAARAKRRVAVDATMVLVIIVLMVQMWLLTATLEAYLAGHPGAALPAMLASGVMSGVSLLFYRLVVRLDRAPEPEEEPKGEGPWSIGG